MTTFRLAHVSDFHVSTRPRVLGVTDWLYAPQFPGGAKRLAPSSYDPHLLQIAVRRLYLRRRNLHALLVTGDAAASGRRGSLDLALEYADAPAHQGWLAAGGRATFRSLNLPLIVLPGNHDRYHTPLLAPAGKQFDQTFAGYWTPAADVQTHLVPPHSGPDKLAVVAGDLCLRSHLDSTTWWGWLGQGKAYGDVLEEMKRQTTDVQQKEAAAVVWAVHFPPLFPGIPPVLDLVDGQDLVDAALEVGVDRLFCGHTHQPLRYDAPGGRTGFPGPVKVHCAGTAAQYVAPHGNTIHLIDVEVDHGAIVAVRQKDLAWDPLRGNFV